MSAKFNFMAHKSLPDRWGYVPISNEFTPRRPLVAKCDAVYYCVTNTIRYRRQDRQHFVSKYRYFTTDHLVIEDNETKRLNAVQKSKLNNFNLARRQLRPLIAQTKV
jgi:hypothetical protein